MVMPYEQLKKEWADRREAIVGDFFIGKMTRKEICIKYDLTYPRICRLIINAKKQKKDKHIR
jgi:hypothetical protein